MQSCSILAVKLKSEESEVTFYSITAAYIKKIHMANHTGLLLYTCKPKQENALCLPYGSVTNDPIHVEKKP